MSTLPSIALLGGPASGKTTFLGSIADALNRDALAGLRLRGLAADNGAFERLADPLLDAQYPQRTKSTERQSLELPLRLERGDETRDFTLLMSDYAGEEVERLFEERTRGFSPEWRARANAQGILIFLRPDALVPIPQLIDDATSEADRWEAIASKQQKIKPTARPTTTAMDSPERIFGPGLAEETIAPARVGPHHPVQVPTALAVIELLQFLRFVRGLDPGERPPVGTMRIGFVATAWDAIPKMWREAGPHRFLAQTAPLLEDFLWSNFHPDDVFRFGLPATGGDLRDARYRDQYLDDPHGFVEWADVTGTIQSTQNLSMPIAWLLLGDQALSP